MHNPAFEQRDTKMEALPLPDYFSFYIFQHDFTLIPVNLLLE